MTSVLVVDDSRLDQRLAGSLLEEIGIQPLYAGDGKEAIEIVQRDRPDLVLTDLQMPHMNGFELVSYIRRNSPSTPVILMTAFGSEDIAVQALQRGAASYVSKSRLAAELEATIHSVLAVANAERRRRERIDALTDCRFGFSLEPHMEDLDAVVSFLQDSLRRTLVCNESDLIRIGTALHEAVVNANEHGNLELSSDIRESDPTEYHGLVKLRARQKPYSDRRVYVGAEIFQDQAVFVIRDEGSGFEHAKLPDPTQSENIGKVSGRGLFLIRTFMDDVSFNAKGNEITLVKRVGFSAVDNCRETGQVG